MTHYDEENNLKLIGKNEEDLKIISAYLQDSVVILKDIFCASFSSLML